MPTEKRMTHFGIITPEGTAMESEACELIFMAHDGEIGVLANHAPMMAELGMGFLRFRDAMDRPHAVYVNGGFCHISDEKVTFLTTEAVTRSEITPADARMIQLEAESMPEDTSEQRRLHRQAVLRAHYLVKLAQMND